MAQSWDLECRAMQATFLQFLLRGSLKNKIKTCLLLGYLWSQLHIFILLTAEDNLSWASLLYFYPPLWKRRNVSLLTHTKASITYLMEPVVYIACMKCNCAHVDRLAPKCKSIILLWVYFMHVRVSTCIENRNGAFPYVFWGRRLDRCYEMLCTTISSRWNPITSWLPLTAVALGENTGWYELDPGWPTLFWNININNSSTVP